jgi:hypothetical protein
MKKGNRGQGMGSEELPNLEKYYIIKVGLNDI